MHLFHSTIIFIILFHYVFFDYRYSFNVTFSGQNGNCYISQFKQSDCINPYKDVTGFEIEPYETYCTINFHTESTHKCYNITIEVGNMAGVNTVHWFYEPFHQVPLVIESSKHVQKGQISHAQSRTLSQIQNTFGTLFLHWIHHLTMSHWENHQKLTSQYQMTSNLVNIRSKWNRSTIIKSSWPRLLSAPYLSYPIHQTL